MLRESQCAFGLFMPRSTDMPAVGRLQVLSPTSNPSRHLSRPGILVLVNDTDWELEGELDYRIQEGDSIMFISSAWSRRNTASHRLEWAASLTAGFPAFQLFTGARRRNAHSVTQHAQPLRRGSHHDICPLRGPRHSPLAKAGCGRFVLNTRCETAPWQRSATTAGRQNSASSQLAHHDSCNDCA